MKTDSMTQQQKREKAAELLGWKDLKTKWRNFPQWENPDGEINFGTIYDKYACLPDYPNDLNAMHEAEKVLTEDQQDKYQTMLTNLVDGKPINTYCHWSDVGSTFTVHATAAQRLDAWLEVMMEEKQ